MSSDFLDNPKLFRHLVEDLPVGIYIVDRDGRIRFWNHGAEQLTGHLFTKWWDMFSKMW
jgi:PAS domain S-box-containing protein